ncbi:MAG: hypothetical protein AB1847_07240 [bacterium]
MSQSTRRFSFGLGQPEDKEQILEILEQNDFKGRISILYTRRPNAYASLKKEGDEVSIVVCKDSQKNKIVGFGACGVRKLYINGKEEKAGYLFALRERKEYKKTYALLSRGYHFLHSLHQDVPLFLTTILEENLYAQKLLEKKRACMPAYEPFGLYEVYTIKTKRKDKQKHPFHFKRTEKTDIPALVKFLNYQGKKYQFFPVIEREELISEDCTHEKYPGLTYEDFFILYGQGGEILAAGAAWDQKKYKQYIIQGYKGILKFCSPLSSLLASLGYPALVRPGTILKFFTLSFWAVRDNDPYLFTSFLNQFSASLHDYPFFLIGLHEKNPLRNVLRKIPHLVYRSRIYLVDWNKSGSVVDKLEPERFPYLECGML